MGNSQIRNGYPGPAGASGDGSSWFVASTDGGGVASPDGKQYVQVDNVGLFIGTNFTANTGKEWIFGTDGNLSAPGNISSAGTITASSISVTSVVQYANLTTTQITAISPTSRGMTVFNYTTGNIQVYNGTKWANITLS